MPEDVEKNMHVKTRTEFSLFQGEVAKMFVLTALASEPVIRPSARHVSVSRLWEIGLLLFPQEEEKQIIARIRDAVRSLVDEGVICLSGPITQPTRRLVTRL